MRGASGQSPLRDLARFEHFSREALDFDPHRRRARLHGDEQVVIHPRVKTRLRIAIEIPIALKTGIEIGQSTRKRRPFREVAEARDQGVCPF